MKVKVNAVREVQSENTKTQAFIDVVVNGDICLHDLPIIEAFNEETQQAYMFVGDSKDDKGREVVSGISRDFAQTVLQAYAMTAAEPDNKDAWVAGEMPEQGAHCYNPIVTPASNEKYPTLRGNCRLQVKDPGAEKQAFHINNLAIVDGQGKSEGHLRVNCPQRKYTDKEGKDAWASLVYFSDKFVENLIVGEAKKQGIEPAVPPKSLAEQAQAAEAGVAAKGQGDITQDEQDHDIVA